MDSAVRSHEEHPSIFRVLLQYYEKCERFMNLGPSYEIEVRHNWEYFVMCFCNILGYKY